MVAGDLRRHRGDGSWMRCMRQKSEIGQQALQLAGCVQQATIAFEHSL